MRLFENGPMSKRAVYEGTWYGKWVDGYHSSIWAKLLDDELIVADGGRIEVKNAPPWYGYPRGTTSRARGKGRTPIYHITDKGKHILAEMLVRCNDKAAN